MRVASILRKRVCSIAVILVLTGCSSSGSSPDAATGLPGSSPSDAGSTSAFTQALVADLQHQGFMVSQGYPTLYQASDCERFTYALTANCYGNNPAAPYIAMVVKPWPDEYVDPAVANVMTGVVPGYSGVYRFDPREALVVFGRMPPPGRYFSLQTWVYSQQGHWNQSDYDYWAQTPNLVVPMQYLFDTLPANDPHSTRVQSFSAISNIVNNVVVERQSSGSFGQMRYFVVTPDQAMDSAVRVALARQGVTSKDVLTEPVPLRDERGSIGPLGLGREANDFVTLMRYTIPQDPTQAEKWRTELPLTVLRVRAPSGTPLPYPPLVFDPRAAVDEVGNPQLTRDFTTLVHSVCDRARAAPFNLAASGCEEPAPASSVMVDLVRDYGWTGPYCRSVGMNCQGDQQDAAYFFLGPRPLDDGEIYAVVGTLGTRTGNATYAALSVNNAALLKGAANVLDTAMDGSAGAYAPAVQNADKFYVWYFARDCNSIAGLTDGRCTTITPEMVPLRDDATALGDPALRGMFQIGLREYVKPGTARGPDSTHLITPRVLTFTRGGSSPR